MDCGDGKEEIGGDRRLDVCSACHGQISLTLNELSHEEEESEK